MPPLTKQSEAQCAATESVDFLFLIFACWEKPAENNPAARPWAWIWIRAAAHTRQLPTSQGSERKPTKRPTASHLHLVRVRSDARARTLASLEPPPFCRATTWPPAERHPPASPFSKKGIDVRGNCCATRLLPCPPGHPPLPRATTPSSQVQTHNGDHSGRGKSLKRVQEEVVVEEEKEKKTHLGEEENWGVE